MYVCTYVCIVLIQTIRPILYFLIFNLSPCIVCMFMGHELWDLSIGSKYMYRLALHVFVLYIFYIAVILFLVF